VRAGLHIPVQIRATVADKKSCCNKILMDDQVCSSRGVLPGDRPSSRHKDSPEFGSEVMCREFSCLKS